MIKKTALLIVAALFSINLAAQNIPGNKTGYPEQFKISVAELKQWLNYESRQKILSENNPYVHQSLLELNTRTGDMQLLRIRLAYFKNSLLMIQVNGEYSTQVFITSSDKSVFYKGRIEREEITMVKCKQDDIVIE